jgi:hypothetical protein
VGLATGYRIEPRKMMPRPPTREGHVKSLDILALRFSDSVEPPPPDAVQGEAIVPTVQQHVC